MSRRKYSEGQKLCGLYTEEQGERALDRVAGEGQLEKLQDRKGAAGEEQRDGVPGAVALGHRGAWLLSRTYSRPWGWSSFDTWRLEKQPV